MLPKSTRNQLLRREGAPANRATLGGLTSRHCFVSCLFFVLSVPSGWRWLLLVRSANWHTRCQSVQNGKIWGMDYTITNALHLIAFDTTPVIVVRRSWIFKYRYNKRTPFRISHELARLKFLCFFKTNRRFFDKVSFKFLHVWSDLFFGGMLKQFKNWSSGKKKNLEGMEGVNFFWLNFMNVMYVNTFRFSWKVLMAVKTSWSQGQRACNGC